jgi:vitamin B12 transporter
MKMKKGIFVLAAAIFSSQLWAQPDTSILDEAVITASKFTLKTSETGKVVLVITSKQLEKSGGKDLSRLLTEQAGIYIGGAYSNEGKDKSIYLRGASPAHCLFMIDGVPVYDPSGIGGNFDIRNLAISQVERIEIVKGSQSTLYGSDAIAGVINIITKKNTGKKLSGSARLLYGSHETFKANASINGQQGKVDYDAAYAFNNTEGINEAVSKDPSAVTDKDNLRQHNIQLGLGFRPGAGSSIRGFFRYGNTRGALDLGAFTDELDYTYSQKSWQAGMKSEFAIGKTRLDLFYQFNHIDRLYIDDSVKSRNGFDIYSKGSYKGSEHIADAFIHFPIDKQLKFTGGVDYRSSESDQDFTSISFFGPYTSQYSSDSLHHNQVGIYGALNWHLNKGFNAEAGARINFHSAYGGHDVYNFNPSWLINRRWKLFGNISSGFRTASLYQLFSEYGNKNLEPESGVTMEAGIQYYSVANRGTARAVIFYRKVKNGIFFFFDPVTFRSQYINQDRQKDHGFELELVLQPHPDVRIKTFYEYVSGKIITKTSGRDTTYFNLLRRPKSSAGLDISWDLRKNLFVSSHIAFTGDRKDAYFDNTTFSTVYVTLDNYFLWNLYAEYSLKKQRISLFLDLQNVTDTKYQEIAGFNTSGFAIYGGLRFKL